MPVRFFQLGAADPLVALRTFKLVALANGKYDDHERALLVTAARCVGVEVDVDMLEPMAATAVAEAITDPADRLMILQGAVLMAIADGDATRDEIAVLHQLRDALGVDEGALRSLERLADGHRTLAMFEMMRRAPILGDIRAKYGLGAFAKLVAQLIGLQRTDEALAWRYEELGLLAEGTLGREFWRHCRQRRFGFPGERGGLQEFTVQHDFLHVLTGYDTDPDGEMQIAAFTAGMRRDKAFFFLFFPVMMFNVGVGPTQVAGVHTTTGLFDPDKLFAAMERGHAVTRDLILDWDYWPEVELPVVELRRKYGISPP